MKDSTKHQIFIALIGAVLFIPFLGGVHLFDWDEINFAESAREMIVTGDYRIVQIDFQPFWEKPPLFIWMQVLSMKIFGINEFAARFPNAICGIVTLLVLYNIGRKVYDNKFGILWTMVFGFSFLPFIYFKSGIIDPWFNLFIFLGVYFFIIFSDQRGKLPLTRYLIYSAIFIGLGILTKGPVALLIFLIAAGVFWILNRFKLQITLTQLISYGLVLSLVGGFWFGLLIAEGKFYVVHDFIMYQIRLFNTEDAGHAGFPLYHVVIILFGVFPASIFALPGFFKQGVDNESQKHFRKWMIILFLVVLILFSIVKTKIVHYSSMTYFPLTFISAYYLKKWMDKETSQKWYVNALIAVIGCFYALVILALLFFDSIKRILLDLNLIKDQFAVGNLQAEVQWNLGVGLIAFILISGLLLFFYFKKKDEIQKSVLSMFVSSMLFIYFALVFITPNVERYSQNAAIQFYQSLQNEDVYIEQLGFKSYAHLFYSQKRPVSNPLSYNQNWLLTGNIDKPVYFVFKNTKKDKYLGQYSDLHLLYEKNGFIFAVRNPTLIPN